MAVFSGGYVKTAACFVAGTLVATANGLTDIETIKAGDYVLSTDPDTMKTEYKQVLETYIRKVDRLVHLIISGEEIITTVDHPFYVQGRGFIDAGNLLVGDTLINVNGEDLSVDDCYIEECDFTTTVYNFQVEDYHTYFVGNCAVWVHNAGENYAVLEPDKYTELTESEVRDILTNRGLNEQSVQDLIDSFDGSIYKREGVAGETFTITESALGEASGVFVTRGSAGLTPTERIDVLALPPNNSATVESTVQLTRSQVLLEGKVAAQPEWALIADDGIQRNGGGWQVITDGGKYSNAIER